MYEHGLHSHLITSLLIVCLHICAKAHPFGADREVTDVDFCDFQHCLLKTND